MLQDVFGKKIVKKGRAMSDLQIAIINNDSKFLEAYDEADKKRLGVKKKNDLFIILDEITYNKGDFSKLKGLKYSQFIINEMLSRNADCLPHIAYVNMHFGAMTDKMHYEYLKRVIRKDRRYYKDYSKEFIESEFNDKEGVDTIIECVLISINCSCSLDVAKQYRREIQLKGVLDKYIQDNLPKMLSEEFNDKLKSSVKTKDMLKKAEIRIDEIVKNIIAERSKKNDRNQIKGTRWLFKN